MAGVTMAVKLVLGRVLTAEEMARSTYLSMNLRRALLIAGTLRHVHVSSVTRTYYKIIYVCQFL